MSTKKNFLYNTAYQILLVITPIVTIPYLSRVLGQDGVGIYSYTNTAASYFVKLIMLGLSTYGVREIAQFGTNRNERSKCFWSIYAFQLLCGIIMSIAYLCYIPLSDKEILLDTIMWMPWVVSSVVDVSWLFFGCQDFRMPTIRAFTTKLLSVIAIFVFVKTENDVWIYCLSTAGASFVNQVVLWPFIKKMVDPHRPSLHEIVSHIKPNLTLFIPVVASTIYSTAGTILLGNCSGMDQTGLFNYGQRLCYLPLSVATSLGTVMIPRMTDAFHSSKPNDAYRLLANSMWIMIAMASAFMWGIIAITPEFVPVFLGDGFAECTQLIPLLSLIILFISLTDVIGNQYLIPKGKDREYTFSLIVGSIVFIAIAVVAIPRLEAMGAVIASVGAEFSVLVAQIALTRKPLLWARMIIPAVPFLIIGFAMFCAIRWTANVAAKNFDATLLSLFVEIVVGALSYTIIAGIWCTTTKNERLKSLIGTKLCAKLFRY